MDLVQINNRVDSALKDNRRAEHIIIGMSVSIFVLGMAGFVFAYIDRNPYIGGGSTLLNGLLYWPIREILKLRRDNLLLQVLPSMLATLAPAEAAKEIKRIADHLRGSR
jgi:hypothetical protein